MSPISITFCVSDNFSQHLSVVIASFLRNNPSYDFIFHVLHRNISEDNQKRIIGLEKFDEDYLSNNDKDRMISIKFHAVDQSRFENYTLPPGLEHVSQETFYRYIIPDVLNSEKRTIYIDVDVICVADIMELWSWDLKGKVIGAISTGDAGDAMKERIGLGKKDPYYAAGMLVMDLQKLREGGFVHKLMEAHDQMARDDKLFLADQDVINVVVKGQVADIPMVWDEIARYNPFRKDVKIWHFPGALSKPWCPIWKNRGRFLYYKYLRLTPYRDKCLSFMWMHIKGFVFFRYARGGYERTLILGMRVSKRKLAH